MILCYIALATLVSLWFLPKLKLLGGKSKKLPHRPWTLPIIGSLHHVASLLPHRRMMELSRRHGPLMHLMLGEVPTVLVSSTEAASLVMKTNDVVFVSRSCGPTQDIVGCSGRGIVFAPYGDRWRQMRKICIVELLSATHVRRMEGIRATEVGSLLRSIAAAAPASTINVSAMVASVTGDIVARAVLGGKFTHQEEFHHELNKVIDLMGGFILADLFPSSWLVRWLSSGERNIRTSYGLLQRILTDIIDGRRAARAYSSSSTDDEDLLDVLLRLQEEDSLSFPLTTEIISVVIFVSTIYTLCYF